jgi:hypothetical protein
VTDTIVVAEVTGYENAPAVWSDDWLPDSETFPELVELRQTYLRIKATWEQETQQARELKGQLAAVDEARQNVLGASFAADEEPDLDNLDKELLEAELAEVQERSQAAATALLKHINHAIAVVAEHEAAWQGTIGEHRDSVDVRVANLQQQIRDAEAERNIYWRLENWITRTKEAASFPYLHNRYGMLPDPPPTDPAAQEARVQQLTEKSFLGGLAPGRFATEDEHAEFEARRVEAERGEAKHPRAVQEGEEYELNDLEEDDLVDWIMGAGMFDGWDKPFTRTIVEAAEEDPDMAHRLIRAERRAWPTTGRQAVIEPLTEIANRKAA